jgi:Ser/Thr protein kinase RdoA (MazF antagonist)
MTVLPIVHTIVDAVALGPAIAAHYDFPPPFHCELLARGMNDVYMIVGGKERYAARLWRAKRRTEGEVTYELDLLDFLLAEGLPVVPAIKTKGGKRHFAVEAPDGIRYVALFEWARGDAFAAAPTATLATQMGELIGKMHQVTPRFVRAKERPLDVANRLRSRIPYMERLASYRPDLAAFFRSTAERLAKELDRIAEPALMAATHGDSTPSNFFIDNGRISILDFETCGYGFMSHELASFNWSAGKNGLPSGIAEGFIAGYDRSRPRPKAERELFPLFMTNKVFDFLGGFSYSVNALGHSAFRFPGLDWMAKSVERHAREARLI